MNPYYEQKILHSEPMELIRIVYQRAISCVREALEHLRRKRIAQRAAAIADAYEAITQLLCALKPEVAPELCAQLAKLYVYMQQRLLDANAQQTEGPLLEVLGLLTTLEEGWRGAAAQLAPRHHAKAEAQDEEWHPADLPKARGYGMSI